jgi:hypothetical protein
VLGDADVVGQELARGGRRGREGRKRGERGEREGIRRS